MKTRIATTCLLIATVFLCTGNILSANQVGTDSFESIYQLSEYYSFSGDTYDSRAHIQLIYDDMSSIEFEFNAEGIGIGHAILDNSEYSILSWENAGVTGTVGEASLPAFRKFVEIPSGAELILEYTVSNSELLTLSELSANRIFPVQPPQDKSSPYLETIEVNDNYYSHSGFSAQDIVSIDDYITVRGRTLAVVTIRPVEYSPADGQILVHNDISIHLDAIGGNIGQTYSNHFRYDSPHYNSLFQRLLLNPDTYETDELPQSLGFLIISDPNDEWLNLLEPFVAWKRSKGYHTSLVTTDETGTTNSEIRNYIIDQYENADIPPSFVILVGDVQQIPNFIGQGTGTPNTDLPYAAIDGNDYFPDIGVSRFSITSTTHLENILRKTYNFEQVLWTGNDGWETHASFLAGQDNYQITEGTHNFVISTYLDPLGYESDRIFMVSEGGSTGDITDAVNDGRAQVTYSGHGGENSWADGPPFSQNNVRALVNTVYPFVQSYACVTGSYHQNECFAETWIRVEHGALAFMGSSVNSYWTEDDLLERKVYEAIYNNQTPGDNENITWINGCVDYGKMSLYEQWGNTGTVRRYFEMYNMMGDGSVDLWTNEPISVTVDHPSVFFLGTNELSLTISDVPSWALVCAMSDTEEDVYASGYADANGEITLVFDTPPLAPGAMIITVTGHDIEPYIESIPITPADGPYVVADSVAVLDEEAWNPNGAADHDETVDLTVWVRNIGVDDAGEITLTITSEDENVIINDDTETLEGIAADQCIELPAGFEISIDGTTPDDHRILFTLTVSGEGQDITSRFTVDVCAPDLVIEDIRFLDFDGNNNHWIDPGETGEMIVTLLNQGATNATNILSHLDIPDTYVTVIQADSTIGSLASGSSTSIGYLISADENTPMEREVSITIAFTGDHNYADLATSDIIIGDHLRLPSGPDSYGYSLYDPLDQPFGQEYDWIEISQDSLGPGTQIAFNSDDQAFTFDLPFEFMYYGNAYEEFSVGANGWIAMGVETQDDYSNSSIPNAGDGPTAMIAPYWEDLSPQRFNSGGVWQYYDEQNHRFIVEWAHIEQYSPEGNFETFEVILLDPVYYPTVTGDGAIIFQYHTMSSVSEEEGTIGIENPAGTIGIQYFYDGNTHTNAMVLEDEMALMITTGLIGDPMPPLPFSLLTPADESLLSGDIEFSWEESIDPNPSDPVDYTFHIYIDGEAVQIGDLTDTEITVDLDTLFTLENGDTLTWYVTAHSMYPDTTVECLERFTIIYDIDSAPDGAKEGMPTEFSIASAYPNPFNPSLSITIGLPERADLRLNVYNVLGRQVATLADGPFNAGYHSFLFDAQHLSSGIYFVRADNSHGILDIRKVTLIK